MKSAQERLKLRCCQKAKWLGSTCCLENHTLFAPVISGVANPVMLETPFPLIIVIFLKEYTSTLLCGSFGYVVGFLSSCAKRVIT